MVKEGRGHENTPSLIAPVIYYTCTPLDHTENCANTCFSVLTHSFDRNSSKLKARHRHRQCQGRENQRSAFTTSHPLKKSISQQRLDTNFAFLRLPFCFLEELFSFLFFFFFFLPNTSVLFSSNFTCVHTAELRHLSWEVLVWATSSCCFSAPAHAVSRSFHFAIFHFVSISYRSLRKTLNIFFLSCCLHNVIIIPQHLHQ